MIPELMRAVHCDSTGTLVMRDMPVPRPATGEVLVRVAASPINPSDLRFLSDSGAQSRARIVPGLEGSGTVIAAGDGVLPRLILGRRVAFASAHGGAWAEYTAVPAMRCIPLRKHVRTSMATSAALNVVVMAAPPC